MQKLIDKIIYKSLTVSEFLDIMKPYHYPFDLSTSYIADFFITNGSSLEETYIVMCIPTCYDVAENLLKKNAPNILRDIDKGTNLGKILKGLNYRDILIESFNLIYVNPWELHTVIEIGESQRMALLSLEKVSICKICTPEINFIVATLFISSAKSGLDNIIFFIS